jgi:beta-mannosidase
VDDQLVTLLPGESVVFRVSADPPFDPDAITWDGVLRSGNDLVAGPARLLIETVERVA